MGLVQDSDQVEYRTPFLDYDLAEFLLSIPHRLRVLASFKRQLLAKKFPQILSIPYQGTGLAVNANVLSILGQKIVGWEKRNFVEYDRWMRNELRGFVISTLLNQKALSRGYFKADYIGNLVDLHLSGKQNLSSKLGALLAFELWNRFFLDGEKLA